MKILSIALLGAGFLASGPVAAKDYPHAKQPTKAHQLLRPLSRGRDGLGANPFHPEGPGNVVD